MKTVKRTGIALAIALTFPWHCLPLRRRKPLTNSKAATMTENTGSLLRLVKWCR